MVGWLAMGLGPDLVLTAAFCSRAAAIKHIEGERSLRTGRGIPRAKGGEGNPSGVLGKEHRQGKPRLTANLVVPQWHLGEPGGLIGRLGPDLGTGHPDLRAGEVAVSPQEARTP